MKKTKKKSVVRRSNNALNGRKRRKNAFYLRHKLRESTKRNLGYRNKRI